MIAVAAARVWLRRMAAAAPSAWHYDPVFRWSAIGAGAALALFVLRLADSSTPRGTSSVPAATAPAAPGSLAPPGYRATSPPVVPKIAPGRSLDGVTVMPAPERDSFGTISPTTRR
jgi:hypothetical protein